MLVEGLAAVPLIGMMLIRRSAAAGSLVSSDWAHDAFPSNNEPAAAVVKTDARQNFLATVHREPLLTRIPSSHALVSDPDSRRYRPVRDHIMP